MTYNLKTYSRKILADTITPVSVYLKVRDRFPASILLESSDYHANDNSFSYICCNPIAWISVEQNTIRRVYPDGSQQNVSRFSLPMFIHPRNEVILKSGTTALDYLQERLYEIRLK